MTKFIILDRDGVINQDSLAYIKRVDEFVLLPGSIEAIAQLTHAGYKMGIATNQSGVSRGLYTEATLNAINQYMIQSIESVGGKIDAIEYCIHLPDEHCVCRKPQPGMLHALAHRLNIPSLSRVDFVGDRISDIQAARAAGAKPVIIVSTMTDMTELMAYPEVPVYHSLTEYAQQLLHYK